MCRWLAYSGSPVLVEDLLYKPKHSLIEQSLHSTMGAEPTNGDGFGVGWFHDGRAVRFRRAQPIWTDASFREIGIGLPDSEMTEMPIPGHKGDKLPEKFPVQNKRAVHSA